MKHKTQEFKAKVVGEFRSGAAMSELQRKYGVSTSSIRNWHRVLPKGFTTIAASHSTADTDALTKTVLQQRDYIARLERVVLRHVVATN